METEFKVVYRQSIYFFNFICNNTIESIEKSIPSMFDSLKYCVYFDTL